MFTLDLKIKENIIYTIFIHGIAIVGSSAQKLKTKKSDIDMNIIFSYYLKDRESLNFNGRKNISSKTIVNKDEVLTKIKKYLNLNYELEDVMFFESSDFCSLLLKNDPNILDSVQPKNVIYKTNQFDSLIKSRSLFFSKKQLSDRIIGMSTSLIKRDYKNFKIKKDEYRKNKSISRALFNLYILKQSLSSGKYISYLKNENEQNEILEIRKGNFNENELLLKIEELKKELKSINIKSKTFNFEKIDKLVIRLSLFELSNILIK